MKLKAYKSPKVKVDPDLKDYGNDPYFVNKLEEMKAFMKKAGPPIDLLKMRVEHLKK